jgi:outer membrane protein
MGTRRRFAWKLPAVALALLGGAALPIATADVARAQGRAPAPAASSTPTATSPPTAPSPASSSDLSVTLQTKAPSAHVLTLADAERAAVEQPQMLLARSNTAVASAQADQAFAPMLPQVTGTASYLRETGNYAVRPGALPATTTTTGGTATSTTSIPPASLSQTYDYWNAGITASQLIYDFGMTPKKYDAAKKTVDAQRATEQTTKLQVVLNVRKAYFTARANKDLEDVAQETLDDQNRHLVQVKGFVDVGTQPEIALAQQKAAVANAVVALITAQNNYETAKAQLNQAAGITTGTEYDVSDETFGTVDGEDLPRETLVASAMAARPELSSIAKLRESQEATLSSAKGSYGPSLAATAGFNEVGLSLTTPPGPGLTPNWNVGAILTWNFYQGGLTRGQVRQAEAGIENADAQRAVEELQVRLDVDSARLAVRAAKATIGASEDAVTSAKEQLRLAEQRYATGVGSIIELDDAQVAYSTAAAQLVQARYSLASARAQLLAALGRS